MSDLPAVGSVWLARDGRIMRVEQWYPKSQYAQNTAKMAVLNPSNGMRRMTRAALDGFGTFLQPHQENAIDV